MRPLSATWPTGSPLRTVRWPPGESRFATPTLSPPGDPCTSPCSKYVGLPLHEFQDFSAALSGGVERVVVDLRAGRTPNEQIQLDLRISIDPNAQAEFHAAIEALKNNE